MIHEGSMTRFKTWLNRRGAEKTHKTAAAAPAVSDAAVKAAYERGRRDERAARRRSPLLALAVVTAALVGGASLVLAAKEGSFREGGAVMDATVTTAAREAGPAMREAASGAGQGLREVRDRLSTSEEPS